jgi:hypothetical protein
MNDNVRHYPVQNGEDGPLNRRKKVKMYSVSGRNEERKSVAVNVRIVSLEHPELMDSGITENVSPLGLQARVGKRWNPNEPVLIESSSGDLRSRGWVVYCRSASGRGFTVGLRLMAPQRDWIRKVERTTLS